MHQRIRWLLAAMMIGNLVMAQAEVYKWTDAEGRVHYGDEPPSDSIPEFRVKPPPVLTPDSDFSGAQGERERRDKQRRLLDSFEADRREREAAEQERKQVAARRKKNCRTARSRLRSAQDANLIFDYDKQGNRIFYDKAQREAYLKRLREDVSTWCD